MQVVCARTYEFVQACTCTSPYTYVLATCVRTYVRAYSSKVHELRARRTEWLRHSACLPRMRAVDPFNLWIGAQITSSGARKSSSDALRGRQGRGARREGAVPGRTLSTASPPLDICADAATASIELRGARRRRCADDRSTKGYRRRRKDEAKRGAASATLASPDATPPREGRG